MLFSSIPFLYFFLPAVLILYFITPKKLRNAVLLLASLVFYAWGEPIYVFLMLGTVICGYFLGLLIEKFRGKLPARLFLMLALTLDLAVLGFFKYADFFIENFNAATGLSLPLLAVALPVGISFFTFQILSYTIDVYRGDVPAQKNPVNLATYIAMFPQLIAGPIVRYRDVAAQLDSRRHSVDKASLGVRRFVLGLSKKVLIANQLGELVKAFSTSADKSVLFFWLYAAAVSMQIYFDFSGYSDMAIGLGKLFGFDFSENFNYPFISKSISEFWRRWHISLGSWFRDYVYIPLGGNRVKRPRWIFNILTVWLLTGFWHGAAWNFIVWGLFFAILLIAEKHLFGEVMKRTRLLPHIYVLLFVTVSFVIFNSTDMKEALACIGAMFGAGNYPLYNAEFLYYLRSYSVVLAVAAVGSTPLVPRLLNGTRPGRILQKAEPVFLALLLILITAYLVDGSFNPFLYFRF